MDRLHDRTDRPNGHSACQVCVSMYAIHSASTSVRIHVKWYVVLVSGVLHTHTYIEMCAADHAVSVCL